MCTLITIIIITIVTIIVITLGKSQGYLAEEVMSETAMKCQFFRKMGKTGVNWDKPLRAE